MAKPVLTIDANETAKAAGEKMKKNRKGCLIVVKDGKPIGIVSDSDLINKVLVKDKKASTVLVEDIMSAPLVTIRPTDSIVDAANKIKRNNIHRLPVVDKGKVVGLISLTDIARSTPEMIELLEYRLKMKEAPIEITEKKMSGICDACGSYDEELEYVNGQWLCSPCREALKEEE
ncbi:MAG: CBS domain-containing protein [Candidatus Aenigmatarchaeota archaeon]